jgi:hypothetical protein
MIGGFAINEPNKAQQSRNQAPKSRLGAPSTQPFLAIQRVNRGLPDKEAPNSPFSRASRFPQNRKESSAFRAGTTPRDSSAHSIRNQRGSKTADSTSGANNPAIPPLSEPSFGCDDVQPYSLLLYSAGETAMRLLEAAQLWPISNATPSANQRGLFQWERINQYAFHISN